MVLPCATSFADGGGGGQISGAMRGRTGGPDSDAQSWSSIQKAHRKRIKLLNCEVCKFGFRGARSDVRFCSSACRQWSYRARRLGGGGGPISSAMKGRTGGTGSYANFSVFLKQKTHFWGRKLQDELWAQGCGLDVRCWENRGKHLLALSFSVFDPQETFRSANGHAIMK
jgi:hypothetical protein